MINIKKSKKAVSLMISYAILITIAVIMSILVFSYLRIIANIEPVIDCKQETSISIEDYTCETGKIELDLKNNGRFNVDGFIATFGENVDREPIVKLVAPQQTNLKNFGVPYAKDPPEFENTLKPGILIEDIFFKDLQKKPNGDIKPFFSDSIKKVKIQPYIIDKETGKQVVCTDSVFTYDLENCIISQIPFSGGILLYKFDDNFNDYFNNYQGSSGDPGGSSVNFVTSLNNKAVLLDGTINSYVDISGSEIDIGDTNNNDLSISVWVKWIDNGVADDSANTRAIVNIGNTISDSGENPRYFLSTGLFKNGQDKLAFSFDGDTPGINNHYYDIGSGLNDDNWHHVVAVKSTLNNLDDLLLYVDGVPQVMPTTPGNVVINTDNRIGIGNYDNFIGSIDELIIFNKALSADEVSTLYNSYNII